jgi:hypothetical protein
MLFPPGKILITDGAAKLLYAKPEAASSLVMRHLRGDWGDMDAHDRQVNNEALRDGFRLFSQYTLLSGARIWIITEADRSATTILLPEEY